MEQRNNSININEYTNFIWKVADLLRGDYKQSEYGDVILPFTVITRLDSVLLPTKDKVLELDKSLTFTNKAPFFEKATGMKFYNTSNFTLAKLKDDAPNIASNLRDYIGAFSPNVQEILDAYDIYAQIVRLDKSGLLYLIVSKFVDEIDLSPNAVPNDVMGYIFEELIRRFSEMSNETAGEHFTPREVIRLMVSLIFDDDGSKLSDTGVMTSLYDPAAGTGGMLAIGSDYLKEHNNTIYVDCYGQELNAKTYAICKSDMLIKSQMYDRIFLGNSFTNDYTAGQTFSYMLCNPPFGVEWRKYEKEVKDEAEEQGYAGRFGAGLPRISDGSFLFLQHMISKMKPVEEGGSRIAIVFNGSSLFTGDAGSGESEIRRWIIENDWLEAIVALPDQMFYNTGISTYIWIVTNRKNHIRKGKIQLINAVNFFEKMQKSLGNKRNQITEEQINQITGIYHDFLEGEYSKIFFNEDFGYNKITVERPLRLNFCAARREPLMTQAAIAKLKNSSKNTDQQLLITIISALDLMNNEKTYTNRKAFQKDIKKALKEVGSDVNASLLKAIWMGLSEKDETADICTDSKGNPEPDVDLRDYENVPLKEDIHSYFEREVLPHVSDAWIDESKTKKGYEISFTRYFYKYIPLRGSSVILGEIKKLEDKIQGEIAALFAE